MEDATETLSSKKASSDGEHIKIVATWVTTLPHIVEDGADPHSDGIEHLGNDECETDGVPVGNEDPELLRNPEVLNHDGNGSEDGETNGGVAR